MNSADVIAISVEHARRLRPLFGTFCAIEATGAPALVDLAVSQAFEVMTHVDERMHPTRHGSDLQKITAMPNQLIEIDQTTWHVLAVAKELCELSDGVFDPCLPLQPGRLNDVELLEDSMVMCHAPVAIDLGGIAKGFAVDQAIRILQQSGCRNGIVNAGGDVRVFGTETHTLFLHTQDSEPQQIALCNAALAATDVDATNPPSEHRGYYTRINKRELVRRRVAVTSNSTMIADALTKCALYCTDEQMGALTSHYNAALLPWR